MPEREREREREDEIDEVSYMARVRVWAMVRFFP